MSESRFPLELSIGAQRYVDYPTLQGPFGSVSVDLSAERAIDLLVLGAVAYDAFLKSAPHEAFAKATALEGRVVLAVPPDRAFHLLLINRHDAPVRVRLDDVRAWPASVAPSLSTVSDGSGPGAYGAYGAYGTARRAGGS